MGSLKPIHCIPYRFLPRCHASILSRNVKAFDTHLPKQGFLIRFISVIMKPGDSVHDPIGCSKNQK